MMPKRVKFRKSQRGKNRGVASRGNTVAFGEFGLQAFVACLDHRKADRSGPGRLLALYAA